MMAACSMTLTPSRSSSLLQRVDPGKPNTDDRWGQEESSALQRYRLIQCLHLKTQCLIVLLFSLEREEKQQTPVSMGLWHRDQHLLPFPMNPLTERLSVQKLQNLIIRTFQQHYSDQGWIPILPGTDITLVNKKIPLDPWRSHILLHRSNELQQRDHYYQLWIRKPLRVLSSTEFTLHGKRRDFHLSISQCRTQWQCCK